MICRYDEGDMMLYNFSFRLQRYAPFLYYASLEPIFVILLSYKKGVTLQRYLIDPP